MFKCKYKNAFQRLLGMYAMVGKWVIWRKAIDLTHQTSPGIKFSREISRSGRMVPMSTCQSGI